MNHPELLHDIKAAYRSLGIKPTRRSFFHKDKRGAFACALTALALYRHGVRKNKPYLTLDTAFNPAFVWASVRRKLSAAALRPNSSYELKTAFPDSICSCTRSHLPLRPSPALASLNEGGWDSWRIRRRTVARPGSTDCKPSGAVRRLCQCYRPTNWSASRRCRGHRVLAVLSLR